MFLSNQLHLHNLHRYTHNFGSDEACEAACFVQHCASRQMHACLPACLLACLLACWLACLRLLFCSDNNDTYHSCPLHPHKVVGIHRRPFVLHACPCQDCSINNCRAGIVCTVCTPSCDSMKVVVISEQLPVHTGQMQTQADAGNWTRRFCRAEKAFRACTHTHDQMTRTTLYIYITTH